MSPLIKLSILSLIVFFFISGAQVVYYCFFISPQYFLTMQTKLQTVGKKRIKAIYGVAYFFGILRIPFIVLPYICKLICFFTFQEKFKDYWNLYSIQIIRLCGDFANFVLTYYLMLELYSFFPQPILFILIHFFVGAELLRLSAEKVPMIFSGIWQKLPHKKFACLSHSINCAKQSTFLAKILFRYCAYYCQCDHKKREQIIQVIKQLFEYEQEIIHKLDYVTCFTVFPNTYSLRAGSVRHVACGEIFIHKGWVNDPWLLMGQLMRRSPWIFDPRYVQRPFFYRTETNRLATLFVFGQGFYNLPYVCYQFGHEIKVARYDMFFRLFRLMGLELEDYVNKNGDYDFDPLIRWLARKVGIKVMAEQMGRMQTDDEVLKDICSMFPSQPILDELEIAVKYTYPLLYVQEVLHPKILEINLENLLQQTVAKEDIVIFD